MPAEESIIETLPNDVAADWLRGKALTNARVLRDMKPEVRARAFAVSGIEDMRRLKEVREAVARIPEGGSWEEAREKVAEALGDAESNRARAETVVRTNAFQAYSAARYRAQMADKEVFPYLKYVTVGDDRVRDSHKALDGLVLRKDDDFWKDHYPPWDWGCRCIAVELTEGMAEEEQAEGTSAIRTEEWSRQWRAAHHAADEARDYQHRPGSLTMALDEVAWKKDGKARYDIEDLRKFNEKMEGARIERTRPDGTFETLTVREWMWRPVREKTLKRLRDAGKADGREHAVLVDRDTGARLGYERVGTEGSVEPDWNAGRGRNFAVYHNHPSILPDFSPKDVLRMLEHGADEIGAVSDGGATMRLRPLVEDMVKNDDFMEKLNGLVARMAAARGTPDELDVADEWLAWLNGRAANGGTGLFDIRGEML